MITIDVSIEDKKAFDEIIEKEEARITFVQLKRFEGSADILQAVVALSPLIIPLVAKVIIEHIRSKKYISVKYKGVEITGISEKNVLEILSKYQSDDYDI